MVTKADVGEHRDAHAGERGNLAETGRPEPGGFRLDLDGSEYDGGTDTDSTTATGESTASAGESSGEPVKRRRRRRSTAESQEVPAQAGELEEAASFTLPRGKAARAAKLSGVAVKVIQVLCRALAVSRGPWWELNKAEADTLQEAGTLAFQYLPAPKGGSNRTYDFWTAGIMAGLVFVPKVATDALVYRELRKQRQGPPYGPARNVPASGPGPAANGSSNETGAPPVFSGPDTQRENNQGAATIEFPNGI